MLMKKEIRLEEVNECMEDDDWSFGKNILYDMCRKNPLHINKDIIIGKLWLIGRSYAAAIERRKNASKTPAGDDFYTEFVSPKIISIGSELDARINYLNQYSLITEEIITEILKTHHFLLNIFSELTTINNRSLASKYLHFHVPQLFYIYDSRAIAAARKLSNYDKELYQKFQNEKFDAEYLDLVLRCFEIQKYAFNEYQLSLTPRHIDNLLLKQNIITKYKPVYN